MISLVLRHRFIFAPILLSSVMKHFAGLEHTFRFYDLVRDYLPEERERLLALAPADAAGRFVQLFSKRYFPISQRRIEAWEPVRPNSILQELTRSIPLEWRGMESWRYDSGEMSPAQLRAAVICVYPFEGSGSGARVAAVDRFIRQGGETNKWVPVEGYKLERVEDALRDSPYPGLLSWCRWIFARTGNRWLDTSHGSADWGRENVDALTRDWPAYLEADRQMKDFNHWLKVDFPGRSAAVIKYVATKIPKTLAEVLCEEGNNGQERLAIPI